MYWSSGSTSIGIVTPLLDPKIPLLKGQFLSGSEKAITLPLTLSIANIMVQTISLAISLLKSKI